MHRNGTSRDFSVSKTLLEQRTCSCVSNYNNMDSTSLLSLKPMVSKTSANILFQAPHHGVTHTQSEESRYRLFALIAQKLSFCTEPVSIYQRSLISATLKHNLSSNLVVQYVPDVPRKPHSNSGKECVPFCREKEKERQRELLPHSR